MVVFKKIVFKQWVYNVPKQTLCYILHQIAKNVLEISIWGTNISRIPISKFSILKDIFFFFFLKKNKIKLFIFSHHSSFIKSCPRQPGKMNLVLWGHSRSKFVAHTCSWSLGIGGRLLIHISDSQFLFLFSLIYTKFSYWASYFLDISMKAWVKNWLSPVLFCFGLPFFVLFLAFDFVWDGGIIEIEKW